MDLTLRMRDDQGLLYATYSGEFSLEDAKRTFLQILEALEAHKVQKVVVDGRAITGEPSTIERFLYGEFVAEEVLAPARKQTFGSAPQFAYILMPPVLDPYRLGENVALNRGMLVKAFDNLNDGLEWLGISSSSDVP